MQDAAAVMGCLTDARNEEWREIPGTDGVYNVSSHGRVQSLDRTIMVKRHGGLHPAKLQGRLLGGGYDTSGYRQVWINGRFRRVSTVVAEAFIGPRPKSLQVCHNDGDRRNDRLDNLRYDTAKGNQRDCLAHGTFRRGSSKPTAKLSEADILEIRAARGAVTQRILAKKFGVAGNTIKQAQLRRTWRHV